MSSAKPVPQQLVIDAGPQGAGTGGHGHADALSVQLLYGDRMLLQDPGTFEYVGDASDRDVMRGSAAHNTLVVDGRSQSNPQGPFAWERLTRTQVELGITAEHFDLFRGSHDGYASLGVTHRRWVFHLPGRFWMIRDVVEGHGVHNLELSWHLGGDLQPLGSEGRFFSGSGADCGLAVIGCENRGWKNELRPGWWSPVYGCREESWKFCSSLEGAIPAETATVILPLTNPNQTGGKLRSFNEIDDADVRGYTFEEGSEQHGFFFRARTGPWMHAGWASDAEFVYYRVNSEGLCDVVVCNGSFVEAGGVRLASAQSPVPYCQIFKRGDKTQVSTQDGYSVVLHQNLSQTGMGRVPALTGIRDRVGG